MDYWFRFYKSVNATNGAGMNVTPDADQGGFSNSSTVAQLIASVCNSTISGNPDSTTTARPLLSSIVDAFRTCDGFPTMLRALCASTSKTGCEEIIQEGLEMYCNDDYNDKVCAERNETTTIFIAPPTPAPTLPTIVTTESDESIMPLILGGLFGVFLLLVVGIGLFCFCRKKKAPVRKEGRRTMTGTSVSGTKSISEGRGGASTRSKH